MFSIRKRPVDEPFLLAPTTANHIFKRRAPIYIKSHGRMIPRFRVQKCAPFYSWPHKTELHGTCHANWFSCPFYDHFRSALLLGYTCFLFVCTFVSRVARRLKSKKEWEKEYWFANSDKYIVDFYVNVIFSFFFFFVNTTKEVEYK